MSNPTNPTPIRPASRFESALSILVKNLLATKAPRNFSISPCPDEFVTVADHVREASRFFDEWLAAIGHEIADNATTRVDQKLFLTAYTDAVDGNALYECERASAALIEEYEQHARRAS